MLSGISHMEKDKNHIVSLTGVLRAKWKGAGDRSGAVLQRTKYSSVGHRLRAKSQKPGVQAPAN